MSAPETVSMPRAEGGEFWAAVARTGLESEDRTENHHQLACPARVL
jgi:hypothetical protein